MEYYVERILLALDAAIGTPIKVDLQTLDATRGKYARVCVEIRLDLLVVGRFWFKNHWFNIEYEGLHLLCTKCGLYGHVGNNCHVKKMTKQQVTTVESQKDDVSVSMEGETHHTNSKPNYATDVAPKITEEVGLHGEWLIVNKRKPSHKKKKQNISIKGVEPVSNKKPGVNPFTFLKIGGDGGNEVATYNHGLDLHENPKIWTNNKNKRSRNDHKKHVKNDDKSNGAYVGPSPKTSVNVDITTSNKSSIQRTNIDGFDKEKQVDGFDKRGVNTFPLTVNLKTSAHATSLVNGEILAQPKPPDPFLKVMNGGGNEASQKILRDKDDNDEMEDIVAETPNLE